jgi:hypothetical protein
MESFGKNLSGSHPLKRIFKKESFRIVGSKIVSEWFLLKDSIRKYSSFTKNIFSERFFLKDSILKDSILKDSGFAKTYFLKDSFWNIPFWKIPVLQKFWKSPFWKIPSESFKWDQKVVSGRFLLKDSSLKDSGFAENIFWKIPSERFHSVRFQLGL